MGMQFDVGRFLDLKPGSWPLRIMRWAVYAAVISVSLIAIGLAYTTVVVPLIRAVSSLLQGATVTVTPREAISGVVGIVLPALTFVVVYRVVVWRILEQTRAAVREQGDREQLIVDQLRNESKSFYENIQSESTSFYRGVQDILDLIKTNQSENLETLNQHYGNINTSILADMETINARLKMLESRLLNEDQPTSDTADSQP